MSRIETGGPAFPTENTDTSGLFDGMTLRDYFAAKAMQGLLSDNDTCTQLHKDLEKKQTFPNGVSIAAYKFADAMLEARK